MTLGEKLFQRRTELGLSQSEVADTQITRNMLSRLEHDQASPSVKTLSHLASKLGVSVSWLLEDGPISVESRLTEQARTLFLQNDHNAVLQLLWDCENMSEEGCLLLYRSALICAQHCLHVGTVTDARRILCHVESLNGSYITEWDRSLVKQMLAICALADGMEVDKAMDAFLQCDCTETARHERELIQIAYCLLQGRYPEAEKLIECLSDQGSAAAQYLRGRLAHACGETEQGVGLMERALWSGALYGHQKAEICKLLEKHYLDLEDYKQAYQYASMRMDLLGK